MRTLVCIYVFAMPVLRDMIDKTFRIFGNKFTILFSLLFFITIVSIKAQPNQLRFKHYTTMDGLSQGFAYSITQDSRGFMWFSTSDGVNRFDGYNFKVFKSIYDDSNSIEGSRANSIIEDKNGILWIGTNEALNRYDFRTDSIKHFFVFDSLHQKFKGYYKPFFIDEHSELWFMYSSNLASINLVSGKITTYSFANGVMEGFISVDYPERKFYKHLSKIYTTGLSGLHIIDMDKRKIDFYFSSNPKNKFGSELRINEALEDKNHILWLATMKGLMCFNLFTKEIKLYDEYNGKKIISLIEITWDKNGNLWCTSNDMGLSMFDTTAKKFISNYCKNPVDPESISRNSTSAIFIDRDNNIWTGINPNGIDLMNPSYQQLTHIKINLPQDESYTSSIGPLCEIDTNNLIVSSNLADLILYNKSQE